LGGSGRFPDEAAVAAIQTTMTDTSPETAAVRPAEDPALIDRARRGDRVAQAKLYSDTLGDVCRIFAAALRLPASHLDVRGAAADVFADLCERDESTHRTGWERYEPPPEGLPFRGFVRMVAHRRVARLLRDRSTRRAKHAEIDPQFRERGVVHAERQLEAAAEVRAVFARLAPAHARALALIDVGGVRIADAVSLLGLGSYGAVNSLLGRARAEARRLREAF
jgi:DNA-directed RNA polymerase specialized sigma24 family protein